MLTVTCLSVNCPERTGGKCWFADGRTKQSRKVKEEWTEFMGTKEYARLKNRKPKKRAGKVLATFKLVKVIYAKEDNSNKGRKAGVKKPKADAHKRSKSQEAD